MTNDPYQIWNLLIDSKLHSPEKIQSLVAEFKLENRNADGKTLASWLVGHKHVTEYQAQVLMAELDGPFHYGNYTVTGRFKKGQSKNQSRGLFKAAHAATKHGVLLEFFPGFDPADLDVWRRAEATVESTSQIEVPQLMATYESVILKNHRFVACENPASVLMAKKLPRKARLPWQKASFMFGQIGLALAELHQRGVVHGAVSPRTVWFQKSGLTQLRLSLQSDPEFETLAADVRDPECKFDYLPPEWSEDSDRGVEGVEGAFAGDIYSWACTFVRAFHGRAPFAAPSIEAIRERHRNESVSDLSKYELPESMLKIIHGALEKNPADRPADIRELANRLIALSGESLDSIEIETAASISAYRKTLNRFKPGSQTAVDADLDVESGVALVERDNATPVFDAKADQAKDDQSNRSSKNLTSAERAAAATEAMRRRKKNRWQMPAAIASALLLMSAVIGVFLYQASRTELADNDDANAVDGSGKIDTTEAELTPPVKLPGTPSGSNGTGGRGSNSGSSTAISDMKESERPIVIQELVNESQSAQSIWQTPTTGPPVDFSGVPAAAKLVFVFRPSEILDDPEGKRMIQGLGPEFGNLIEQFQRRCGLELKHVSQVIVSLHSTPKFDYEPFFIVTTTEPIETGRMLQLWNRPSLKQHENGQSYYSSGSGSNAVGYYQLVSGEPIDLVNHDIDVTSRFAVGSPALIEEVAGNFGSAALFGSLRTMSQWCDADRHVNILYLRPGLFNDEGQKLMGLRLRDFNRELSILIPDSVRGGMLSLHIDEGTYLEMMFEHSLDVTSDELSGRLETKLRAQRDRLTQFVAAIPSNKYWDAVRVRYDNMLNDLFRNLRWEVEHGEVIANAWLPPMAAHNLIAATELVISFSDGASSATAGPAATGPKTIEELLAVKRDLKIANPPDLNLLMADIESEINEEYSGMPFKFRIRLLGADLQKDGITKNQRPNELNMSQMPLGEILTNIMTAANPSKDITGPEDPECKLIWVIADDPENPGQPAVLVTTRDAAAAKSYTLPAQFQLK